MKYQSIILKIAFLILIYCLACEKSAAPVDNESPDIEITYLEEYTYQSVAGTITLTAIVTDNDEISNVDFFIIINDEHQLLSSIEEAPFIIEWDTDQFDDCNTYLIYAIAYDESENSTTSEIHLFTVDNSSDSDIAVQAWLTEGVGSDKLEPQLDRYFGDNCNSVNVVEVKDDEIHQVIDGFGASLTNSSAWLINNSPNRDLIIEKLFSKTEGIGISYIRLAMGSSDFVHGSHYSYAETVDDLELMDFSIDRDREDIIPVLQDILIHNPGIKIMGSPWSAPGWMKTSGQFVCGSQWNSRLKTDLYGVYADYFVKFVEEYALEGIPIDAITIQNEPLYCPWNYPGMIMSGNEQRDFVKYHLGPKFDDNGINTKIVIFDHNWDGTEGDGSPQTGAFEFIEDVYDDPLAVSYIDGTAFHGYGNGDATFQSDIYNLDPSKSIYFTERTNSTLWENWDGVLGHIAKYYFIDVLNHWSKNVLLWNLALDLNNGPFNGGCENCTGLVTVDNSYLQYEVDYYITGHFSKFVDPGAIRLGTDEDVNDIDAVTFRNPDGSHIMVAVNTGYNSKSFFVVWNDMSFYYNLPGQGLVTFKW